MLAVSLLPGLTEMQHLILGRSRPSNLSVLDVLLDLLPALTSTSDRRAGPLSGGAQQTGCCWSNSTSR